MRPLVKPIRIGGNKKRGGTVVEDLSKEIVRIIGVAVGDEKMIGERDLSKSKAQGADHIHRVPRRIEDK